MPLNPDRQQEQAAAQLGGVTGAGCGEGAVGGVPLPLGCNQVRGEGEAVCIPLLETLFEFEC